MVAGNVTAELPRRINAAAYAICFSAGSHPDRIAQGWGPGMAENRKSAGDGGDRHTIHQWAVLTLHCLLGMAAMRLPAATSKAVSPLNWAVLRVRAAP